MMMARRLGFGLSRELWLIEAGIFLNMLGYGAVLPFEVIYLHNGRGFGPMPPSCSSPRCASAAPTE